MAFRNNSLKVDGFENLFCAGTKSGPICLLGAVVTGDLAGYNAVSWGLRLGCLELPKTFAVGAFINYVGRQIKTKEGLTKGYSLKDTQLLKELRVHKEDNDDIIRMVHKARLKDIYRTKLC
jgi:folate-dependent tRNA-U54 methylase TrmFO/GidA